MLLPEAVGLRRAREMSATGNFLDAHLALVWGLANRVVAHDELMDTCRGLAAAIVSNDQDAVRALLNTYDRTSATTAEEGWGIEADVHRALTKAHLNTTTTSRLLGVIERGRSQVADHATEG